MFNFDIYYKQATCRCHSFMKYLLEIHVMNDRSGVGVMNNVVDLVCRVERVRCLLHEGLMFSEKYISLIPCHCLSTCVGFILKGHAYYVLYSL